MLRHSLHRRVPLVASLAMGCDQIHGVAAITNLLYQVLTCAHRQLRLPLRHDSRLPG
jgi:hypothetical protein